LLILGGSALARGPALANPKETTTIAMSRLLSILHPLHFKGNSRVREAWGF
jgi:hypothetical protein